LERDNFDPLDLTASLDGVPSHAIATFASHDSSPDTDPDSSFWAGVPGICAALDVQGGAVPGHATEIRIQWTAGNLYLLFICPYQQLNLRPNPNCTAETFELWNWDVAEVFIGSDFKNIRRYKEFEASPQGEWVDLDIDLDSQHPEDGWVWSSGCEVAARIDSMRKTWYGFMRIPYSAIDDRPAAPGNMLRINFYRGQGPEPNHKEIAWRPTYNATFHVPEMFGTLTLQKTAML